MHWRSCVRFAAKTAPATKLKLLGAFTSALVAALCLVLTSPILVEGLKSNWTLPGLLETMFFVAIFVPLQVVSLLHGLAAVFPRALKISPPATLSLVEKGQVDMLRFFYRCIGFLTLVAVAAAIVTIVRR